MIRLTLILFWLTAVPAFSASSPNPESDLSLALYSGFHRGYRFGTLFPAAGSADIPTEEVLLEHRGPVWGLSLTYPLNARLDIQAEVIGNKAAIVHDVGIGFAGVPLGKMEVSDAFLLTWSGIAVMPFIHSSGLFFGCSSPLWQGSIAPVIPSEPSSTGCCSTTSINFWPNTRAVSSRRRG